MQHLGRSNYDDKDGRTLSYLGGSNRKIKVLVPDANGQTTYSNIWYITESEWALLISKLEITLTERNDNSIVLSGDWYFTETASFAFSGTPQLWFTFYNNQNQPIVTNWKLQAYVGRQDKEQFKTGTGDFIVTDISLDSFYRVTLSPQDAIFDDV